MGLSDVVDAFIAATGPRPKSLHALKTRVKTSRDALKRKQEFFEFNWLY